MDNIPYSGKVFYISTVVSVGAQTFLGILRPHTVIVISFGSVIRAEIHGGM